MTDQDAKHLELVVNLKHLRFRMVRAALALGLTLSNLAKVEEAIGNNDRAKWAVDTARKVHQQVQECLPAVELNPEEKQWAAENLNELEQAIASGSHPGNLEDSE